MGWVQSRPVPWRRLVRDWLFYVVVMVVFLAIFGQLEVGVLAGVLVSGPIFVLLGAALAKLGYQRKTMKELRAEAAARSAASSAGSTATSGGRAATAPRAKPAPTKRTAGGGNRPTRKRR
jgi:MFS superfamily sulfate permease-like transporter